VGRKALHAHPKFGTFPGITGELQFFKPAALFGKENLMKPLLLQEKNNQRLLASLPSLERALAWLRSLLNLTEADLEAAGIYRMGEGRS
jgi:hypothetical protein